MKHVAGEWWESGSWWQFAITIAAGVAVGVFSAWAALSASNPKRKLNWWVQSNTPLMSVPQYSPGGVLALTFEGVTLDNPRIVELVIANQGRRDITSALFHNNDSIRFDFGAVLCTILDVTTAPQGSVPPSLMASPWRILGSGPASTHRRAVGETWLDVEPSLLAKGQVVTVVVLLDGEEKPVSLARFPLVDVTPASEPPGARSRALAEVIARTPIFVGPFRIR